MKLQLLNTQQKGAAVPTRFCLSLGEVITQNHLQVVSGGMLHFFFSLHLLLLLQPHRRGSAWPAFGWHFDLVPVSVQTNVTDKGDPEEVWSHKGEPG